MIKVAACQYHIDLFATWDAYAEHLTTLCEDAAGQGAELLLLVGVDEYSGSFHGVRLRQARSRAVYGGAFVGMLRRRPAMH